MGLILLESETQWEIVFLPQTSKSKPVILQFEVLLDLSVEVDLLVLEQIDVIAALTWSVTSDLEVQRPVGESQFQMVIRTDRKVSRSRSNFGFVVQITSELRFLVEFANQLVVCTRYIVIIQYIVWSWFWQL
jgi:hypothetical protein